MAEGIALCTDFKLQQQIQHERATSKQELGSFCRQFGFERSTPPSKKYEHHNRKRISRNRAHSQIQSPQSPEYYKRPHETPKKVFTPKSFDKYYQMF